MSHFSVLVITPEVPTQAVLEKTLMPWHEYECTGFKEYLQDVDMTDKVLKYYNEPQRVVVLTDGTIVSRWNESLYTKLSDDELNRMFNRKVFELPEGAVEKEITADEARKHGIGHQSLKEAASEYCGAEPKSDGRFYKRTNPSAKWDWWVLGGRYRGQLLTKNPTAARVGEPGVFGNGPLNEEGVDSCQVKDLDLSKMQALASERTDKAHALRTFAVVKDGNWYERGKMGWWAVVFDEKDEEAWDYEFTKLIQNLDLDTWLSIVDCHI
jgi:hypothetical protein